MKSFATHFYETLRKLIVLADYGIWFLFDPSKFTLIDKKRIKKVLVIHLGAMGELMVLTPVLHALKKFGAEVHVLLSKGKEDVLSNNPDVDKILIYNQDFNTNLETLKKGKYDLAAIMWPCYPKIAWICRKVGIKYRIGGFKNIKDGLNFFFTRRMLDLRNVHAVQGNLDVIKTIGIKERSPILRYRVTKEEDNKANKILKRFKLKNHIIIHPGFSYSDIKYPSRLWPAETYAKVADALIEKGNMKIILTGSKEEKVFSDQIKKYTKNKDKMVILNGLTNFKELAAMTSKAKLLIAPGTGMIHLASALNIPILELMGKESPKEWHPWAKNYKILFHPEVCTQCDKNYCRKKTIECMNAITSEEVIKAAKELLK